MVRDLHAALRFVGLRADFGFGVTFQREGSDEVEEWPAEFEYLNVLDPESIRPDFSGLVENGLLDIRDAFQELGFGMAFPEGGPGLRWAGVDEEARGVIDRAGDLGDQVWTRFVEP